LTSSSRTYIYQNQQSEIPRRTLNERVSNKTKEYIAPYRKYRVCVSQCVRIYSLRTISKRRICALQPIFWLQYCERASQRQNNTQCWCSQAIGTTSGLSSLYPTTTFLRSNASHNALQGRLSPQRHHIRSGLSTSISPAPSISTAPSTSPAPAPPAAY